MTFRRILLTVLSLGFVVGIVAAQSKIAKPAKIIDNWLYEIPKTTVAPVIDGIQDPVWKTLDWNFQRSYSNGDAIPDDWYDLMGAHKVMWDDDNMYVLFFTQDDDPTGNDAVAVDWQRNGVEVYFDGDNSKIPGPSVTAPDHHLTFRHEHIGNEATSNWDVEAGLDTTGLVWKFLDTEPPDPPGYWFEAKIPLDAISVPAIAGQLIGLEFQQNDNDGNGREHISKWWEMAGDSSWQFASSWGTGILSSRVANTMYEIKKVPAGKAPTIDGDLDPIYLQGTSVTTNSFRNGDLRPDDWSDAFFRTYALWDDDNMYVFFEVNDEDPYGNDPTAVDWQRNGVEFYLDGDNSKIPGPSVTAPDHHLTFRHEHLGNEATSNWDVESGLDTTGLVWKIKDRDAGMDLSHGLVAPGGYNVEVKVPLDAVDVPAIQGQVIGFELQQNDNDGNGREHILKWWLEEGDSSWQFASTWGTAYLGSEIVTGVEASPIQVPYRFELAQNYPNPFNPSTKIHYTLKNSGNVRLSVYDLLGREVAVLVNGVRAAGSHEVTFSRPDLGSGVYFYKLQSGGQVMTKKMVLLR
jgi:catechol 2,3-dioxygenase-like lactoylglutathione lyase family enzyme